MYAFTRLADTSYVVHLRRCSNKTNRWIKQWHKNSHDTETKTPTTKFSWSQSSHKIGKSRSCAPASAAVLRSKHPPHSPSLPFTAANVGHIKRTGYSLFQNRKQMCTNISSNNTKFHCYSKQ